MSNTIREYIILEFVARAASLVSAPTVYRARPRLAPEEVPAAVIWPREEVSQNIHGQEKHSMPIDVEQIAKFIGEEDPSVIGEALFGELIKTFASPAWDRRRLIAGSSPVAYNEPYAASVNYVGGGVTPPEEGSNVAGAIAKFVVVYYTLAGDPYTQ